MARANSQKFIARNRAPRVQIEYDVEVYGSEKKIQLPFVMGVMADLSGKPADPLAPVADRKALEIDVDNFDARLKSMKPRVAFNVENTLTGEGNLAVDLTFESMDDFSPAAIARKVDALSKLLDARTQLSNLLTYMDGKTGAEELLNKVLADPTLMQALASAPKPESERKRGEVIIMASPQTEAQGGAATGTIEASDFSSLLQKEFKPKTDTAKSAVSAAVQTLAEHALSNTKLIGSDALRTIEAIIAAIDQKLTEQINLIIHHQDFQNLESAWRGLHHLVNNTETDEMLKIRVLNISKKELGRTLKKFKGTAWDQSPVFKKFYEEEYGQFGGEPYGCIVGDYHFDHSPPDVELLGGIAQIAAAAHAPFISGADPGLFQMESWQELANPRDLTKIFQTPEYAAWRSLRESEDSRYIGLTMPRFLARAPYGAKTNPIDEFEFEEDTDGTDAGKYAWANSAYAMAVNINRSFKQYGWCSRIRGIESGGMVEGLPTHSFPTDDGGVELKCPTEIAISDRREAELAKNGFMPLVHRKNTDYAAFIGAQSLQKPAQYENPDATANAEISARLPYLFASCRFAHYLKCIVRDKIGSFKERNDMEAWLNQWISNYVDNQPETSSEHVKASRPLREAKVVVEEVEGNPGYYTSRFYLRPHYQLEGLTVSLRLVSKMPSGK